MSLTLVVGPMCAGKTNYLLSEYSKHPNESIMITSNIDTRTKTTGIWTHDKKTFDGKYIFVDNIEKHYKDIESYKYVLINEGQFMNNITEHVKHIVEKMNKHVVVSGLDGDFNRKAFDYFAELAPLCDNLIKLKARCDVCGEPAPFTKKLTKSDSKVEVGGLNIYSPRCRKHFHMD